MKTARILFALVAMLAVAALPVAGAASVKLAVPDAVETTAADPAHDCCPKAANPCGDGMEDCAGMVACAAGSVSSLAGASVRVVYAAAQAGRVAAVPDAVLRAYSGDPPLRPPRT